MGIACLALAVLAIFTRQKLANYKSDGPKLLIMLYAGNIAVSLGYVLLVMIIVGNDVVDISTIVPSILVSIVMMAVNKTYFDKRKDLFVN